MASDREAMPTLGPLHHVGMVVKDLKRAVDYYSSLGMGPFEIYDVRDREALVHGEPMRYSLKVAFGAMGGGVSLALVQGVEGKGIHDEILERSGGGVNHLAFPIENFDEEVARLQEAGRLAMVPIGGERDEVYLERDHGDGVYIELHRQDSVGRRLRELPKVD